MRLPYERCIFNVKPFDVDVAIVIDDETVSETTYDPHIFIHKSFCVSLFQRFE